MASPYVNLPLVCPLVLWRRGKAGLSVGIPAGESRVECRRVIDNGISFIVSYNIHTLLMHAFYLIIVLIFLVMPKIIDLVGILEELLCLLYIA